MQHQVVLIVQHMKHEVIGRRSRGLSVKSRPRSFELFGCNTLHGNDKRTGATRNGARKTVHNTNLHVHVIVFKPSRCATRMCRRRVPNVEEDGSDREECGWDRGTARSGSLIVKD